MAKEAIKLVAISSLIPNIPMIPKFIITATPRGIMEMNPVLTDLKRKDVITAIANKEKMMEMIWP